MTVRSTLLNLCQDRCQYCKFSLKVNVRKWCENWAKCAIAYISVHLVNNCAFTFIFSKLQSWGKWLYQIKKLIRVVDYEEICRVLGSYCEHQWELSKRPCGFSASCPSRRSWKLHSEDGCRVSREERTAHLSYQQLWHDAECTPGEMSFLVSYIISQIFKTLLF